MADFATEINSGYTFKGESILLGAAMLNGKVQLDCLIKAPLKMFNRHGLIAGATGTGKTKTLQVMAERLSKAGVPVLMMDIKGDLSGLAAAGNPHPKIDERMAAIGEPWTAQGFPVELLSLSDEPGARLRATISEFGPVLLSKVLELNDTQEGMLSLVFKVCDDHRWPLLDIKDLRSALQYCTAEGKEEIQRKYGLVSTSSVGAIMRKLLELEQQGADLFFGERSTEVEDFLSIDRNGNGIIHMLRLTDMQSRPKLFSTFMLCLLAEMYEKFPERGDADRPELVVFIDEAHLIFNEASKALLDQIETIVKLIRSKGVGLFFCTQVPTDVPEVVLSQLGTKIQHALRAFTAKDRKAIKQTSENYPISAHYETDRVLTEMGIGEALITLLNEKGIPTPLAHTYLVAPESRMDVLTDSEINALVKSSKLAAKYNETIDRESAYEMLQAKFLATQESDNKVEATESKPRSSARNPSTFETIMKSPVTRTVVQEITRGILGVFGISTAARRARKR